MLFEIHPTQIVPSYYGGYWQQYFIEYIYWVSCTISESVQTLQLCTTCLHDDENERKIQPIMHILWDTFCVCNKENSNWQLQYGSGLTSVGWNIKHVQHFADACFVHLYTDVLSSLEVSWKNVLHLWGWLSFATYVCSSHQLLQRHI